jgi:hypothetical protein
MTKRLKTFIDNPYSSVPNFERALQVHPTATKFIVVVKNEDVCDFIPYHLRRLVPQDLKLGVIERPNAADLAETHINTCLAYKAKAMYPQVDPRVRLDDSIRAVTKLSIEARLLPLDDIKTLRQMANNASGAQLKSQVQRFTDRYEKHILETLQKHIKQEPTIDNRIGLAFGNYSTISPTLDDKYINEKNLLVWLGLDTKDVSDADIERAIKRLTWLEEQVRTTIRTVYTVPPTAYNTYYRRTFDKLLNTVLQDVLESYKHKFSGVFGAMGFYDLERIVHRFNTPPLVFATTRGGKGSDRS